MAAATVEEAIVEQWLASGALDIGTDVPDEKVFIGQVPLVNEDETAEVLPSYAWLENLGMISEERSSERSFVTDRIRLSVENETRKTAVKLGQRTHDAFKRPDNFDYASGTVLNMKRISREEKDAETDGMWRVSQDFAVLYTVTE